MKFTVKLSTAGEAGFMQIPLLRGNGESYATPDGRLDEEKVRAELRDRPEFLVSSDDGREVFAMAVEFLARLKTMVAALIVQTNEVHEVDESSPTSPAQRRAKRGKFVAVRVGLSFSSSGYRVSLSLKNPNGAVGNSDTFGRIFAEKIADLWKAVEDDCRKAGCDAPFRYVEGEGCEGAFSGYEERRKRAERAECPNRHGAYCAPIDPSCPYYENGRCKWR